MKYLFAVIAALVTCIALPAYAQTQSQGHWYAELTGMYSLEGDADILGVTVDTDATYLVAGGVGFEFNNQIAMEFEVTQSSRDVSGIPVTIHTLGYFGNVQTGADFAHGLGGYLGAGAGMMEVKLDVPGFSDAEWVLGYQGMAGLTFRWATNALFFTEYRYQAGAEANIAGVPVEYHSHNVGGGVRIQF